MFFSGYVNAEDDIHIFMGSDQNYVKPTTVTIASILKNHDGNNINIHLYDFGMYSKSKDFLQSFCIGKGCSIEFIPFEENKRLKICNHWLPGVFAKYWIPTDSYKRRIKKAIWLDGDTIVDGDISELWDIDLGTNYIAGVEEITIVTAQAALGILRTHASLNCGVLLFNCQKMYQDNLLPRLLQKTIELQGHTICVEQEVLAAVTAKHRIILPPEFNFQTYHKYLDDITDIVSKTNEDSKNLAVIALQSVHKRLSHYHGILIFHYDGLFKPWRPLGAFGPYTDKWYNYLRLTPYWGFTESIKEGVATQASRIGGSTIDAIAALKNITFLI
jgi:lipopolysaccharide biosynthesis glycosyltransferase